MQSRILVRTMVSTVCLGCAVGTLMGCSASDHRPVVSGAAKSQGRATPDPATPGVVTVVWGGKSETPPPLRVTGHGQIAWQLKAAGQKLSERPTASIPAVNIEAENLLILDASPYKPRYVFPPTPGARITLNDHTLAFFGDVPEPDGPRCLLFEPLIETYEWVCGLEVPPTGTSIDYRRGCPHGAGGGNARHVSIDRKEHGDSVSDIGVIPLRLACIGSRCRPAERYR